MGSVESTRKLTVSNVEEIGIIKVSNTVVERLQGTKDGIAPSPVAQDVRAASAVNPPPPERIPPLQDGLPPNGNSFYYYPHTISALEIQQQREKELISQEQYWLQRLQNMERNHEKINQIIEAEYRKAMEEIVDDQDSKAFSKGTKPPCIENSNKVLKCYQDHPKEILKCSSLVEEFSNCVDQRRARLTATRC